ncbi:hypothetical protein HF324_01635 [Chitinophaga oryzae]|uniref:Uncharacterized protein n=1 Tax=Chitinophaga oryzae TaxID=2725414 RepID=A0AAE7D519_9BACT|nr:hypothetical protein [Chitinophaga oryzae]QJB30133.1 hypothetical protein HF329_01925 [Chitinophaga oryzae]QJB36631.1 hypothetical protein HF324_01635 [Chitinophaga oryzae]
MKRIFLLVFLLAAVITSASANVPGGHFRGGYGHTVIVHGGFYSPFYAPFGYYYGYPYYTAPYVPTKLDIQITGIKNDYADKIKSVKLDNSLTRQEKREQIREFKRDRNLDILNAQRDYYKS